MGLLDNANLDDVKETVAEQVKNNKGALIGGLIGYFLSDNEKAKSTILGVVAGSLLGDGVKRKEDEE